ncbi:UDP-N-acetylmuramate dehydrogenase [Sphingomonas sp. Leaf10]|uniref:UDP-N-acetylmuramate dehydrogenase n=1 Tax=Sphingomonas sp. Leaf10 TaxID=1735676 RepID=UPI0009EC8D1F|nr:UDP-N-acetylmuramate dehydrogenase [Sphingomonas sp. Leaf10]
MTFAADLAPQGHAPDADVVAALRRALPAAEVATGVPLASLGRWGIGGPADIVVTPQSASTLAAALAVIAEYDARHIVIGDGSNVLFDDAGFRGVVLRIGRGLGGIRRLDEQRVEAGAGMWVPAFVRQVIDWGMAGAVHAIGIPGTLGGLITMNGGSQRKGIGENVAHVDAIDHQGRMRRLTHDQLDYRYRASRLQRGDLIVVSAQLRFAPGDRTAMRREALSILAARRAKFPRVRANCGSVFVSDPALYSRIGPPGLAIERAGLKGVSVGGAQISPDHANFIVNNGGARAQDVLHLILLARRSVADLSGIAMDAEVRHLAPDGVMRPAHEVAELLGDRTLPGATA